ncbi:MAG: DNA repair protein RadC [Chloroflexota bacterium]
MEEHEISRYRIADIESSERPRERLSRLGSQALSTAELLAILLRTGLPGENAVQMAHRLLNTFGGLSGLHRADWAQMCAEKGMGEAKSAQIKAALELGRRLLSEDPATKPSIHSPEDAASLVMYEMSALEQEEMRVMLLNTRNRVFAINTVYIGSLNTSSVRVAELFRGAIRGNAASIILVHNHPSGDPTPSPEDVTVTRAIVEAGKMLDISVLDHIIIGQGRFESLKTRGLGFS